VLAVLRLVAGPQVHPSRLLLLHVAVGHYEAIHSERGAVWQCADFLSLRMFLRLGSLIFQFGKSFLAIFVAVFEQDEIVYTLAVATVWR